MILIRFGDVDFRFGRCEDDDRQALQLGRSLDLSQDFEAVDLWQAEVQEDHVRSRTCLRIGVLTAPEEIVERLFPVKDDPEPVGNAVALEVSPDQFCVAQVILNEQHAQRFAPEFLQHHDYSAPSSVVM